MLIKVFSVLSMLSKLPPGVCWRGGGGGQQACYVNEGWGGGGNRLGLVTKQQAVEFLAIQALEFPQVLASSSIVFGPHACLPSPPPPPSPSQNCIELHP